MHIPYSDVVMNYMMGSCIAKEKGAYAGTRANFSFSHLKYSMDTENCIGKKPKAMFTSEFGKK